MLPSQEDRTDPGRYTCRICEQEAEQADYAQGSSFFEGGGGYYSLVIERPDVR